MLLGDLGEQARGRPRLSAGEECFLFPLGSVRVPFIEGISQTLRDMGLWLFRASSAALLLPVLQGLGDWGWGQAGKKHEHRVGLGNSTAA